MAEKQTRLIAMRCEFKRRLFAHREQMHQEGGIVLDRGARFYRGRKSTDPVSR